MLGLKLNHVSKRGHWCFATKDILPFKDPSCTREVGRFMDGFVQLRTLLCNNSNITPMQKHTLQPNPLAPIPFNIEMRRDSYVIIYLFIKDGKCNSRKQCVLSCLVPDVVRAVGLQICLVVRRMTGIQSLVLRYWLRIFGYSINVSNEKLDGLDKCIVIGGVKDHSPSRKFVAKLISMTSWVVIHSISNLHLVGVHPGEDFYHELKCI